MLVTCEYFRRKLLELMYTFIHIYKSNINQSDDLKQKLTFFFKSSDSSFLSEFISFVEVQPFICTDIIENSSVKYIRHKGAVFLMKQSAFNTIKN